MLICDAYLPLSQDPTSLMISSTRPASLKILCRDLRNSLFAFAAGVSDEVSLSTLTVSCPVLFPFSISPSVCPVGEGTHICARKVSERAFFVTSQYLLIGCEMWRMSFERRYGFGQSRSQSMRWFNCATRLSKPNALQTDSKFEVKVISKKWKYQ